jgi:hypothetical protein
MRCVCLLCCRCHCEADSDCCVVLYCVGGVAAAQELLALGDRIGQVRPSGASVEEISQLPTRSYKKPQPKPSAAAAPSSSSSSSSSAGAAPSASSSASASKPAAATAAPPEHATCAICIEPFADGDNVKRCGVTFDAVLRVWVQRLKSLFVCYVAVCRVSISSTAVAWTNGWF